MVLFFATHQRYQHRRLRSYLCNNATFTYHYIDPSGTYAFSRTLDEIKDSLNRTVTFTYADLGTAFPGSPPTRLYDQITFTGFGGTQRSIKVWYSKLSQALRTGYSVGTYQSLFPNLTPQGSDADTSYDPYVIQSIELPNHRRYQFYYNPYKELARVELPTGGFLEYDYADFPTLDPGITGSKVIYRRLIERRAYANTGDVSPVSRQTYSASITQVSSSDFRTTAVVEYLDPVNLLYSEEHMYYGAPNRFIYLYPVWKQGREYQTNISSATGAPVKSVTFTWQQRASVDWWPLPSGQYFASSPEPQNDPRIVETKTTLPDSNQVMLETSINPHDGTIGFDQYNNQTDSWEYDYGPGHPGTLLRHTHTEYKEDYAADTDIHIRNLPVMQQVFDGTEAERARTTYEYDNYNGNLANHAALVSRSLITGHDPTFSNAYPTRGNVTAISRRLIQENRDITTYHQYDVAGNVLNIIDPRGANATPTYATTFTYTDNFGEPDGSVDQGSSENTYAFVTTVTNALGQTSRTQYDYFSGKPVDGKDSNNVVTSMYYDDLLDRPTKIIRDATNLVATNQTVFTYRDSDHIVQTVTDLLGAAKLKKEVVYDGMGRTVQTRSYEKAPSYVQVDQQYDALGRVIQVSNPYRPTPSSTPPSTVATYDALGRVTKVKRQDGSLVTTTYVGNVMTVTEAGRDRQSTTDALGRLTEVVEDPGATGLKYKTGYTYDVLDNLLTVAQGTPQTQPPRDFHYDSLGRLISVDHPESGIINYKYDDNGNLIEKKDSRIVSGSTRMTITYDYDKLNRIQSKTYNDNRTPDVTYYYDTQTLPFTPGGFVRGAAKGRLVAVIYGATASGEGSYYGYDALGRIIRSVQKTGTTYTTEYTYDLAGNLLTEKYPSGRVVTTTYDPAGRVSSVGGVRTGETPKTYVSQVLYTAHGAVEKMMLGNKLWEHTTYDPQRLQPKEIGLGTSTAVSNLLLLTYSYGTPSQNNGNLSSETINVAELRSPTTGAIISPKLTLVQSYTYDELNRLKVAQEKKGAAVQWKQTFQYDRYGNRTFDTSNNNTTPGLEGLNPSISTTNNHISKPGYNYDPAGNMTLDELNHTYQYDAENRLLSFDNGVGATYSYNGEGQRVKKVTDNGTRATTFVYDAKGKLIAEYAPYTSTSKTETSYLTRDHLGNTRLVTDGKAVTAQTLSLAVKARHDFLPFGEEIASSYGGRSPITGYDASDNTRQKFTGKERDLETGLDYFGARYYASAHGRFTTCDPLLGSASAENPQSWNRYIYVENNPLRYVDDDGRIKRDPMNPTGYAFAPVNGWTNLTSMHAKSGTSYFFWEGNLLLDDGKTWIRAFYNVSAENVSHRNNGNANCHGLTFAGGSFYLPPESVKTLLAVEYKQRDDPKHPTTPQVGDAAVYMKGGLIVHSATVTAVNAKGEVTEVAGIDGDDPNTLVSSPTGQGSYSGITPTYYYRPDDTRTPEQRQADAQQLRVYTRPQISNRDWVILDQMADEMMRQMRDDTWRLIDR